SGSLAKEAIPKRDCGFYMKYIFLFTSLIQFLIILGLVLFMVYGNAQAGTDTHLRLLEEQLQDRYNKIITLSGRNLNLTRTLNATLKEKQGLQVLAQKVQRDLDKCNSTQGANLIYKVSPHRSPGRESKAPPPFLTAPTLGTPLPAFWGPPAPLRDPPQTLQGACALPGPAGRGVTPRCRVKVGSGGGDTHTSRTPTLCPPHPFAGEKATLQSQLDQAALAKKELEEKGHKVDAMLAKATQEQESCQRDLLTTRTVCESSKTNLDLLKHECGALRSDISYPLQHIKETLGPYSCSAVHEQLSRLMQRTEGLFLWQQERESMYRGKSVYEMNLLHCHLNCSRGKQELEKRLQEVEKQVKGSQEEKKKLLVEKEQLGKELEDKSKAAAQAGYFKEQLNICMGSKVRELPRHRDGTGYPPRPRRGHP
uniref:PLVAP protein n=1 Tax=Strix occidentalis caurina TaxID=311401 RepID=A0A8D0FM03_STROC